MSTPHSGDATTTLRRGLQRLVEHRAGELDETFAHVVATGVSVVPGAAGGGITRTANGRVHSEFASDAVVARLDGYQAQLGEGPCVEAATRPPEHGVVMALDLDGVDAGRWPRFAPLAVRLGFRSMLSVNLLSPVRGTRTALNFFGHAADAFDEQARTIAGMFGLQATAVLNGAYHAAGLRRALESRDVIGQAKGILMERFTIDDEAAFRMLVTSSQETDVKLATVARWLVGEALQRGEDVTVRSGAPGVADRPDPREIT